MRQAMGYPALIQQPAPQQSHPHRDTGIMFLILGVAALIGGGIAASYCDATFFGLCIDHPYAGAGGLAIFAGVVLIVLGVILMFIAGPTSQTTLVYPQQLSPYPPTYVQPSQQMVPVVSPSPRAERYCPYCGMGLLSAAKFCVRCGRQLPPA